jgi:hypothetical protein
MHFSPLTLQDITDPATAAQMQQPRSGSTANNAAMHAEPLPTADDIASWAATLPPITLETQRKDEYSAKTTDFLTFQNSLRTERKPEELCLLLNILKL